MLALWKGIRPALLAAVPTVGIYMPLYDIFRDRLEPSLGASGAPLLASTSARAIAVFTVAPLEVLRTRNMSQRSTGNVPRILPPAGGCCIEVVQAEVVQGPATSLWLRGLPATVCLPRFPTVLACMTLSSSILSTLSRVPHSYLLRCDEAVRDHILRVSIHTSTPCKHSSVAIRSQRYICQATVAFVNK